MEISSFISKSWMGKGWKSRVVSSLSLTLSSSFCFCFSVSLSFALDSRFYWVHAWNQCWPRKEFHRSFIYHFSKGNHFQSNPIQSNSIQFNNRLQFHVITLLDSFNSSLLQLDSTLLQLDSSSNDFNLFDSSNFICLEFADFQFFCPPIN